ncbi:MAG TPA: hypothetical protein VN611_05090 [Patescibacteria group bacterium]|nr:hypothetical protein [Patescibacteria group bacterium]
MEFYKPRFDEYEKYTSYFKQCMQMCAESSFLALWSYEEEMEIERAFYQNLYWHQGIWRGKKIWMTPIGEWDRPDWEELLISAVPPGTLFGFIPELLADRWRQSFAGRLEIEEMRDEWDYIFHIDDQILLEGQAFAWMRRLCRKFEKNYPYVFSEIVSEDIPAIIAFQKQWMEWNEQDGKANEELRAEHRTALKILNHWSQLQDVLGAKVTVDGEVISYITVEILDDYLISGHLLKGNYSYKGIYQATQHLLYKQLLANYSILNGWGDGGCAGLRQAKLNLNPIGYVKKYLVTWKG